MVAIRSCTRPVLLKRVPPRCSFKKAPSIDCTGEDLNDNNAKQRKQEDKGFPDDKLRNLRHTFPSGDSTRAWPSNQGPRRLYPPIAFQNAIPKTQLRMRPYKYACTKHEMYAFFNTRRSGARKEGCHYTSDPALVKIKYNLVRESEQAGSPGPGAGSVAAL